MPSRLSRPIYASMFTPVERNFVDYVHSSPRTLLTGERGAFAPSDGRPAAGLSLAGAVGRWYSAKSGGAPNALVRASDDLVAATAEYQRHGGIPPEETEPLPGPLVAAEANEVMSAPPAQRSSLLERLLNGFNRNDRPAIARQFMAHLSGETGDQSAILTPTSDIRASPMLATAQHAGPPKPQSAQGGCEGCECDAPCPTNEKLTCRPYQQIPGDFSGHGYGKATRRGWLWDEEATVKYGCYKCTSESGKKCGFSAQASPARRISTAFTRSHGTYVQRHLSAGTPRNPILHDRPEQTERVPAGDV